MDQPSVEPPRRSSHKKKSKDKKKRSKNAARGRSRSRGDPGDSGDSSSLSSSSDSDDSSSDGETSSSDTESSGDSSDSRESDSDGSRRKKRKKRRKRRKRRRAIAARRKLKRAIKHGRRQFEDTLLLGAIEMRFHLTSTHELGGSPSVKRLLKLAKTDPDARVQDLVPFALAQNGKFRASQAAQAMNTELSRRFPRNVLGLLRSQEEAFRLHVTRDIKLQEAFKQVTRDTFTPQIFEKTKQEKDEEPPPSRTSVGKQDGRMLFQETARSRSYRSRHFDGSICCPRFNRDGFCTKSDCWRAHECTRCHETDHGALHCNRRFRQSTNRKPDRKSNKRNTSKKN